MTAESSASSRARIDVIGGSGFIGTRLIQLLKASGEYDIRIIDRRPSDIHPELVVIADVRDRDALRRSMREGATVINLAAEHKDNVRPESLYDEVNVQGARNICAVGTELNVRRIIFTSSVAVYGLPRAEVGEDAPFAPFNAYGRTKAEAEVVFREWAAADIARTLVVIRPTVVFGEGNRGNVYNLIRSIATGSFRMIGSGANHKSVCYVENCAGFIAYSLTLPQGTHTYNYVDKPDLDMNSLTNQVAQLCGRRGTASLPLPMPMVYAAVGLLDLVARTTNREFPISRVRVEKFVANSIFSTRVAETGFVAPVGLNDALTRTVQYEQATGGLPPA